MASAALVHPDGGPREPGGQRPDPAGVVQVDVREHDMGERVGVDAQHVERARHGLDRRAGAGLHQRGLVGMEEVGGRVALASAHERVDRRDAGRDIERDRLHRRESTAAVSGLRC